MSHTGKEGDAFMEGVVYKNLGRRTGKVIVGPGRGLDNAVVRSSGGREMIVTVDPVSAIPAIGMPLSAWLSVHLIASDFTSSGADPEYAVFAYNFPPGMSEDQREEYVRSIGKECGRLGVAIAAGHTGSYPGGGFTVIGSGSMLGFAGREGYVTPAMAKEGDAILMTKHAAIEATATLALSFPSYLGERVGPRPARRAASMVKLCSTVKDARTARGIGLRKGGISSMHDATEGGVLGALEEMATASGKAFEVDPLKIPVSKESRLVCSAFGLDPLKTMGEGTLLITCPPDRVSELGRRMSRAAVPMTEIGRVSRGRGLWLVKRGRRSRARLAVGDGFWPAYDGAVSRGLE